MDAPDKMPSVTRRKLAPDDVRRACELSQEHSTDATTLDARGDSDADADDPGTSGEENTRLPTLPT